MFRLKNKKSKGFTLVELLAVLAILSIIITVGIYTALNIVNETKENSYKVTINNVEKSSNNYVMENSKFLQWRNTDISGYEYQCITVKHLIDKGYFSNDLLDANVTKNDKVESNNYIYIERNKKNKAISKQIFLHNGLEDVDFLVNGLCNAGDNFNASINFDVEHKEPVNGYVKSNKILIHYNLYNVNDSLSNYSYMYNYDSQNIESKGNFDGLSLTKELDVIENGTLNAKIDYNGENKVNSVLVIDNIDNEGPIIVQEDYNGDSIVKKSVIIPLKVTDKHSGVDANSFTIDDIKVTIGGVEVNNIKLEKTGSSGNDVFYNLTINDRKNKGIVEIVILDKSVLDNLENESVESNITTNISFVPVYDVIYYLGDGTSVANSTQIGETMCVYGEDCTLKKFVDFGKEFPVSSGSSPDNHWVFEGWINENKNALDENNFKKDYSDGQTINLSEIIEDDTINLYAIGKKTFRFYSGVNPSSASKILYQYWNPHSTNANYLTSITIPKQIDITGWQFIGYKGGSGKTNLDVDFDVSMVGTTLKPAYDQARYIRSKYNRIITIKFDANGGTGTMKPLTDIQIYNSGYKSNGIVSEVLFNLPSFGFTKKGYSPVSGGEWKSKLSGNIYKDKQTGVKFWPAVENDSTVVFEAQWTGNTYTIKYRVGNGSGSSVIGTQLCTYDKNCVLKKFTNLDGIFPYSKKDNEVNGKTNYSWNFYGWTRDKDKNNIDKKSEDSSLVEDLLDGATVKNMTANDGATVELFAIGRKYFEFNSGIAPKNNLTGGVYQYWNPRSTDSDYLTFINVPKHEDISTWEFIGYRAGSSVASSTVTSPFTAANVGKSVKPSYDTYRINRGVYKRTLTINYNANGGSGTTNSSTDIQYYNSGYVSSSGSNIGANVSTPSFKLATNEFTRTGYNFNGWKDKNDGKIYPEKSTYNSWIPEVDDIATKKTLYAQWIIASKKVHIKYKVNGGKVTQSTKSDDGVIYTWTTDNDGIVYKNGNVLETIIDYGESTSDDGLINYNNKEYLNITRDGYGVKVTNEWKCLSGDCEGKIYSDSKVYEASDFCDSSNGDCTVILGVNWMKIGVAQNTNNGAWHIWARPGIVWHHLSKSVWVYNNDLVGVTLKDCKNYDNCSWQKNYYIGAWERSKFTLYIRMSSDGQYIYEDDVIIYKNNNNVNRPFIRVWVSEKNINEGYGCVYAGNKTNYKVGGCNGYLQSIEVNGKVYWSVWVPWSCKSSSNCPRNEVSITDFPETPPSSS